MSVAYRNRKKAIKRKTWRHNAAHGWQLRAAARIDIDKQRASLRADLNNTLYRHEVALGEAFRVRKLKAASRHAEYWQYMQQARQHRLHIATLLRERAWLDKQFDNCRHITGEI